MRSRTSAEPEHLEDYSVLLSDIDGGHLPNVTFYKPTGNVSPFAKAGTVDHTQYDTASILRLVTRRFGVQTLPGLKQRFQDRSSRG